MNLKVKTGGSMKKQNATFAEVRDHTDDRKYFILVPRIVGVKCQDVYEKALWSAIKEVAGEEGECYLSIEQLAALSDMSTGKVSQSIPRMIEAGLLKGEVRQDDGYPQAVWHLSTLNLWKENIEWCEAHPKLTDRIKIKKHQRDALKKLRASKKKTTKRSLHLVKPSPDEGEPSSGEAKNIHKEDLNLNISTETKDLISFAWGIYDEEGEIPEPQSIPIAWDYEFPNDIFMLAEIAKAHFTREPETESEFGIWIKDLRTLKKIGITPEDLDAGFIEHMQVEGWDARSPLSIRVKSEAAMRKRKREARTPAKTPAAKNLQEARKEYAAQMRGE